MSYLRGMNITPLAVDDKHKLKRAGLFYHSNKNIGLIQRENWMFFYKTIVSNEKIAVMVSDHYLS